MKIILGVVLLVMTAQIPSCQPGSDSTTIFGYVEDKYIAPKPAGGTQPVIIVLAVEYEVPWEFYREVRIGDLVKYENGQWTIVRRVPR